METLKIGSVARLDTFSGLIPCKVTNLVRRDYGLIDAIVTITKTRGAYKKGETVTALAHRVVPVKALRYRKYSTRIMAFNIAA